MRWFRSGRFFASKAQVRWAAAAAVCALGAAFVARAELAPWLQEVVSPSAVEAALYRAMELPGVKVLFPRPPAEARGELDGLVKAKPDAAELYALRARVDEQGLDFAAAEADWKAYAAHAQDKAAAALELAAYYGRRVQGPQQVAALEQAASVPAGGAEAFVPADRQPAWQAFAQAQAVVQQQALGDDAVIAVDRAWVARYPQEPAARAALVSALLRLRRFTEAEKAVADYETAFPQDKVFPVNAAAALAQQEGSAEATAKALTLYDKAYQPLWPSELVHGYFQLLASTHTQRTMLAAAQARLAANPEDYAEATRVFFYYQQQGRGDAAVNALAEYGASKKARGAAWSAEELQAFAVLLDHAGQYEDAARYYFALASTPGSLPGSQQTPEEAGLTGIVHVLLAAPERPIDLGSGNLSMYRDVATLDQGPGYWNGVLSLWLNSTNPAAELSSEEAKAQPYFHRAKAAELLAVLDRKFPAAPGRPELHAMLLGAYGSYGDDTAVRAEGEQFLREFPQAAQRLEVALEVADADARQNDTRAEFALYDSLLKELAVGLQGMPLTAGGAANAAVVPTASETATSPAGGEPVEGADASGAADEAPASVAGPGKSTASAVKDLLGQSLAVPVRQPATAVAAEAYRTVLERYLGRLTQTGQQAAALAVLRGELDRNPNDPLLYSRLADFLQQNDMAAQQEEVYRKALARFGDATFYDKLARFYLRAKRRQDFDTLTRQVVDIFHGTELETYFGNVSTAWPQEYLQLNLYAHQRFPHDLRFTRNLLAAYEAKGTRDPSAREKLLREHWQEAPDLQAEFFEYLSRTHGLEAELAALQALAPGATEQANNPAAAREIAELDLWQSHYEASAPLLGTLAEAYPADTTVGDEAASVFRSLAYQDPAQVARAVRIEERLVAAEPGNLDRLATVGDTYANSVAASMNLPAAQQLALAAPYWRRMSAVHPGEADGYLQAATVFWDYFQFDDALAQIEAARQRFGNPALYGYEAGAIEESRNDSARAVAEYVRAASVPLAATPSAEGTQDASADAAADDPSLSARLRLVTLARRPGVGELVDRATAAAVEKSLTLGALELRVAVLKTRQQASDVEPLVLAAVRKTASVEDAAALAGFSRKNKLVRAYDAALEREIALAVDPVERIELQYELARAKEDQGDVAGAQRIVEAVYRGDPRIVGVVRATVDFYWRTRQPQRAVGTLVEASHAANTRLARDFTLEAVVKSNQSGDYAGARGLLKPLLAGDAFNAQLLSLYADSYALAHDEPAVRDFDTATLAALQKAPMPALEKRDKVALVRQGLIVALTDLKDYSGGLDQHVALISAFPEDTNVLDAAAAYARRYGREPQLVGFLQKTVSASPQDSRFAIDLGRVDVRFEDYDGALAAYSRAIAIRKDRVDLYVARADLEEHQQAFDAACADYERLYVLSYKDAQWMEKVALARARQGKNDLAVKALETAWVADRPQSPGNEFRVAEQLEQWGMLDEARQFGDAGVKLAGDDLFAKAENTDGAVEYVRLLGRQRKAPEALVLLKRAVAAAQVSPSSPTMVVQQVSEHGLASVTDAQWRVQRAMARAALAQVTYRRGLQALSAVAAEFYTPEEMQAYALLLDAERANKPLAEVVDVWIPAAQTAGLKDREAAWRRDVLLSADRRLAARQLQPFDALEAQRMDAVVRAQTLDLYAGRLKPAAQMQVIQMAAQAWREAGNRELEVRELRRLVVGQGQTEGDDRLFALLLQSGPAGLVRLAAAKGAYADAAANYALEHGSTAVAYQVVAARAPAQPPVWANATNALLGLYFADTSAKTDMAFQAALADKTVGERLQARADDKQQLVGAPWFYYGMRYGVWRSLAPRAGADAEDFLAAGLEQAPQASTSYLQLGRAYADARQSAAAIAEFRHAEELDATDPAANLAIAETMWAAGQHDAAVAEWNKALDKLRAMVDLQAVPETFWTSFAQIAAQARDHQLGPQLKPGMNAVLLKFIRKNGNYRSVELLQAAYSAVEPQGQAGAVQWLLQLAADTSYESTILSALTDAPWFPVAQRGELYRRLLPLTAAEAQAERSKPAAGEYDFGQSQLATVQLQYMQWLLQQGKVEDARRLLDTLPASQRSTADVQLFAILLAAKQSRLPQLLAGFGSDAASAPALATLSSAAETLRQQKDPEGSAALLEYVFTQKQAAQSLVDTDYLALAEARLALNNVPGAVDLLHRLTLQGDLYQNLDSAAALLMKTAHPAEAAPLLAKLVKGVPWDASYRLRLGQAELALKQEAAAADALRTTAADPRAPYDMRAQAAVALRGLAGEGSAASLGSAELTLLASAVPNAEQAGQPYFVRAKQAAAMGLPLKQRAPLLLAALKEAPAGMVDRLRLELFLSEVAGANDELASAAIQPVLQANPGLRYVAESDCGGAGGMAPALQSAACETRDDIAQQDMPAAAHVRYEDPEHGVGTRTQALMLGKAGTLEFVLALATMEEHREELPQAVQDLKTAARLSGDAAQRASLEQRAAKVQERIALAQENARRRPVIQASLDQSVLVRPRLLSSASEKEKL